MNQSLKIKYLKSLKDKISIKSIQILNNEIVLTVNSTKCIETLFFLKNHINCQYKILSCISGADFIEKKNRFEISYELLSIRYNSRIRLKVNVNEITPIESAVSVFSSADWWEREIWDLFGVFFINHPNLRRILTDYGFSGPPLRKDYPLTGFVELRYDELKKRVVCEALELSQEFRTFDFMTPWVSVSSKKKIL